MKKYTAWNIKRLVGDRLSKKTSKAEYYIIDCQTLNFALAKYMANTFWGAKCFITATFSVS